MIPRPCIDCGRTSQGTRCPACEARNERARQGRQPYRAGYASPTYRAARRRVLRRDGWRCCAILANGRRCSAPAREVHHLVPLSAGGSPDDEANLVSVCLRHQPRGGKRWV